jgi:hypothetical protein
MHPLEATQHGWATPPHRHERVDRLEYGGTTVREFDLG